MSKILNIRQPEPGARSRMISVRGGGLFLNAKSETMAILDDVRKNAGRLLAGALFVAAIAYLSSSGLVTKKGLQSAVEENKKYLQNEAGAQGKGLDRQTLMPRCADAPVKFSPWVCTLSGG